MKHINILLILLLIASGIFAQHKKLDESVLECRYKLIMQKDTVSKSDPVEDDMVLRIGKTASQFFSRHTFYHDSLWADPDGRKKAEDLSLESLMKPNPSMCLVLEQLKIFYTKIIPKER